MKRYSYILIILFLISSLSFSAVLFLTNDYRAILYNGSSYIKGHYSGNLNGQYPCRVQVYYIAPNIKDVFNVSDSELLKSFILLDNGDKFFKDPKNGPSLDKNIYNLLNVGDFVYKVNWRKFPDIYQNKIVFPKSFKLIDMVTFVNIINFPIYTEDLLKDYITSNGATVTVYESKPKYHILINKSEYKNLPVSLKVWGDCKKVIWTINNENYNKKMLTFVATRNEYDIKLTVIGELGTSASTTIKMNFKDLLTYEYKETEVANHFVVKGDWFIPFFNVSGSATITYNGQANFIGFEFEKNKTIVHRFVMKDLIPPKIVDNSDHEFYENEPFKVNMDFYDNSGVNYSIFLNKTKVSDFSTMTLKYGKYVLSAVATDNFGNTSRYSTEIKVLDTIPPVVKITNYTVNEGQSFFLDASKCTDNGTIVSYKWILDDKIFYGKRVKVHFDKSGKYNGSLIVTDDSLNTGVGNFTITVKDNIPPLLIFSSTTITASPNEIVDLKPFMASDDSGKVVITWILKNPKVFFVGREFKYKFNNPGKYDIDVIAQDKYHNQTLVKLTIVIK